jgi:hypothetical protein
MLEKLLRARLPEQIIALIEKLEQDPDASHLERVVWLMENAEAVFTRRERWALKRAVRKCRNVLRREQTLNRVMRIVINEQDQDQEKKIAERYIYNQGIQGAGVSLQQYGTLSQHAQQAQLAAQQARNIAQGYYTDARSLYNGAIDPRL